MLFPLMVTRILIELENGTSSVPAGIRPAAILTGAPLLRTSTLMDDLPLHGFDKELERRLTDIARRDGVSVNEAALRLLRRGAGLLESGSSSAPIDDALDRFIGRWSEVDERIVLESIRACEMVDEALWK
jgi:hypothetical protein